MLRTPLLQGKNRLPNTVTLIGFVKQLAANWYSSHPAGGSVWRWPPKPYLEIELLGWEIRPLCGFEECCQIWPSTTSLTSTTPEIQTLRSLFGSGMCCLLWQPLATFQCSCLENPRDGRAWWAAVYGVAQSRTRLKWLSSSSHMWLLSIWNVARARRWALWIKYIWNFKYFAIRKMNAK